MPNVLYFCLHINTGCFTTGSRNLQEVYGAQICDQMTMQSRKCRNWELWSKKAEKKNRNRSILMIQKTFYRKYVLQKVIKIMTISCQVGLTVAPNGIPYILKSFWYVGYLLCCYKYKKFQNIRNSIRCSCQTWLLAVNSKTVSNSNL